MNKIKILIVDDHKLVRNGIKYTLLANSESEMIDRIDEAVNGNEAYELAMVFDYDIILMDINMPELDGIKATAKIIKEKPNSRIIAISMYNEDYEIRSMVKAGAKGYLLKNTGSEILKEAITTVLDGSKYYSNEVALKLMEPEPKVLRKRGVDRNKESILSNREAEVLTLIANEFTNDEIGTKLGLSKRTIDAHRQNILNKLQVKNTAGLIKYAIRMGFV
ncbi:MAG: response regulator transcription factor [Flavobacteriales bacterium]|nr:response regulator transcription factor [Flavobacteriales bacterium]